MGEMADFINEDFADYYEEIDNEEWHGYANPSKTCRCCGKSGLVWGRVDGKWRLFEKGRIHVCLANPLLER